jgi:hypothetical protein
MIQKQKFILYGITPEEETILSVLKDIAYKVGKDGWTLKEDLQLTFC